MKNRITPPYTGKLIQPMPSPPRRASDEDLPVDAAWSREYFERFLALLDHYDLDRADPHLWVRLALYLAIDNVPGLRVTRGRPRTNYSPEAVERRAYLLNEVEGLRSKQPNLKDTTACRELRKRWLRHSPRHPFEDLKGKSVTHLRQQVRLAQKEALEATTGDFCQALALLASMPSQPKVDPEADARRIAETLSLAYPAKETEPQPQLD